MLERLARNKHSSLLRKLVNLGRKKFHNIEPRTAVDDKSSVVQVSNLSRLSDDSQLKCAESYCLPPAYQKLEVPFNDDGVVEISVDLGPML